MASLRIRNGTLLLFDRHARAPTRAVSTIDPDHNRGEVLESPTLVGLTSECPVCGGRETSTGRLVRGRDVGRSWYVEMLCDDCGSRGTSWKREWQTVIDGILEQANRP